MIIIFFGILMIALLYLHNKSFTKRLIEIDARALSENESNDRTSTFYKRKGVNKKKKKKLKT